MDKSTSNVELEQEQTKSPHKSPSKKEIDVATQALNHFAQGKRHLLVNDVQSAVNSLQEACKLLAEQHGETAVECGDAYYYYGRALLEMARVENGVLGNALDGVPEGDDADCSQVEDPESLTVDEKNQIGKQVGDALEENYLKSSSTENKNESDVSVEKKVKSVKIDESANEVEMTDMQDSVQNGAIENGDEKSKEDEPEKEIPETKLSKDSTEESAKEVNTESSESTMECEDAKECTNKDYSKLKETEETITEAEDTPKVDSIPDAKEKTIDGESVTKNEKSEDGEDNSTEEDEAEGDEGEADDDGNEAEPVAEADEPEGDQTSDEEEVGNLQLAWEVLELSKVIYKKQLESSNRKMSLKIADVHLRLGEVALESENYPQSVEELTQCLNIQLKELETTDRCLAETYYQIGVAHSFSDDFEKALANFSSAKKVIDDRIAMLIAKKENPKKDDEPNDDPFYTIDGEIEELRKLITEISEKINDMEEMKKDSDNKIQKAKAIAGQAFASLLSGGSASSSPFGAIMGEGTSSSSSSNGFGAPPSAFGAPTSEIKSDKATSNITHLVRKKRKPEEEVEKDEPKKVKGEDGEPIASVNDEKCEKKETEEAQPMVEKLEESNSQKDEIQKEEKTKEISIPEDESKETLHSDVEEDVKVVEQEMEKEDSKLEEIKQNGDTNGTTNGNGCPSPVENEVEMKDETAETSVEELKKKVIVEETKETPEETL